MILILANVFIAILTEAFMEVKQELSYEENVFGGLLKHIKVGETRKKISSWITGKGNSINEVFQQTDKNDDGLVDTDELAEAAQLSKSEARKVIQSQDVDGDMTLHMEEFMRLQTNMDRPQLSPPRTFKKSMKVQMAMESPDTTSRDPRSPPVIAGKELSVWMESITVMMKEMKMNQERMQKSLDDIMMQQKQMKREMQQIKKRVISVKRSTSIPNTDDDEISGSRSKSMISLPKNASKRSRLIASMLDD